MTRNRTAPLIIAIAAVALSACGGSSATRDTAHESTFVLSEWSIAPPAGPLHAGKVRITATNNGSEPHELVIVRADDATALPTKPDGSVNEDGIPEADKAGEITDVAAGRSVTKTFELGAGRYFAMCNLVDTMGPGNSGMGGGTMANGSGMAHVHYHLGMVAQFTVA